MSNSAISANDRASDRVASNRSANNRAANNRADDMIP